ncbi:MAG: hypothetical protein OEM41_05290 [Ignavibacteria bacterium]|nr:hypothetical protein [Ignavibacteria bacterium]
MKLDAIVAVLLCVVFVHYGAAQTRTDETKKTLTTEKGDTVVTQSVIVSKSEDITPRTGVIVINPLKFFLFYNFSYFHSVSPNVAVGGGFQIPTPSGINGFGVNAEVRIYPSGKSPRGFYVAPNVSYNRLTSSDSESSPFSAGVLLGWQWFPGDEFAIGLGIGVDYYTGSVSTEGGGFEKFDGSVPALRFDIGYAW